MKKVIIRHNLYEYEAKYIISKKKYAHYRCQFNNDRKFQYKYLSFLKNELDHRPCNLGPQYSSIGIIRYRENNKYHNLYGPAIINKTYNTRIYWIYHKEYTKSQFYNYLSLYNNLSYKRIY